MADFKPDPELETKELNETFKTKTSRSPRDVYSAWPTWAKSLARIMVAVIIIVVLVLIGRSIHHHSEQNAKKTSATSNTANQKTTSNPAPTKAGSSSSNSNSGGGSTNPKPNGTPQSGPLPNTGPGDVAALFAVAASAGTGAHYFISRRRA